MFHRSTDSPSKRGNSGAGSSGSPAKHETSTSPVKLHGNDEAHELSSAVCRVFMQHGLAPPGPNTDARVDAIVEAIKSTNMQYLGRKIDFGLMAGRNGINCRVKSRTRPKMQNRPTAAFIVQQ